jgi:patatin-like phospholipase/acyl hydrolase
MAEPLRVLSIDGGGIRGLIPALLLEELERRLRAAGKTEPLYRYFDLIAGTSTGGILAAGLCAPHPQDISRPAATPAELVALYRDEGGEIFQNDVFTRLRRLFGNVFSGNFGGLVEEKYDHGPLEEKLRRTLGGRCISDALTAVLITAYDIGARTTVTLKKRPLRPGEEAHDDYLFWQAARATSAAPTYFEPARVTNLTTGQSQTLVDGGVYANNPSMCAFVEAQKMMGSHDGMVLVALGTGYQNRAYSYYETRNWGPINWINPALGAPIISILMQGQCDAAEHQLELLLNSGAAPCYFRLDAKLNNVNDEMDDASEENLTALEQFTARLIQAETAKLDAIVERL